MAYSRNTSSFHKNSHFSRIWSGIGSLKSGWVNFFWAGVVFFLAPWLWNNAVWFAYYPSPIKTIAVVLAVICILLFFFGIWKTWQGIRTIGLRGVILTVGIVYLLLVIINILTVPDTRPIQLRLPAQFIQTGKQIIKTLRNEVFASLKAPDTFLFAYTGRSGSNLPSGFPTPNPSETPVRVVVKPRTSSKPTTLKPGSYAIFTLENGQSYQGRSGPGLNYDFAVNFRKQERLLILEGPASDDRQEKWWKVHGIEGEGWFPEEGLLPSN